MLKVQDVRRVLVLEVLDGLDVPLSTGTISTSSTPQHPQHPHLQHLLHGQHPQHDTDTIP